MKLFLFFLWCCSYSIPAFAETLLAGAELCPQPKCVSGPVYVEKGCEVTVAEVPGLPEWVKITFVAKIPDTFFDREDLVLKKGAILRDRQNRVTGKAYDNMQVSLLHTWDSVGANEVSIRITGYVQQSRIDPASVIEKEVARIVDAHEGRVAFFFLDSLLNTYAFTKAIDTAGYASYRLLENNELRLLLIFRHGQLAAVVPQRSFHIRYFTTILQQQGLSVYYTRKLKQNEEEFIGRELLTR